MTRRFTRFLRRNTIALLALFVALSGTTFAAANALAPNSVGTKQLKKNAVTSPKIKNNAVNGTKIANNTIKGADVLESSLGKVPSATNADHATNADNATSATNAINATTANTAQHLPALTWTALTLENGWIAYGGPTNTYYDPPAYTKDAEGFVHLRGTLDGSSKTSATFATLPAGFRPPVRNTWLPVSSTNALADPQLVNLDIDNSTGAISAFNAGGATDAFVSLDGVEFYSG